MSAGTDAWNDLQSQLSVCQPSNNDFLADIYPTNGMANWLKLDEEPLESYIPPLRVEQPDCRYSKVYSYNGNDTYPLSPSSPNSQVVPTMSSSPGLYASPNTCYMRSEGGHVFGGGSDTSRALATASYCSPPFSSNVNNLLLPTAPFVSRLMINDACRYQDASADHLRRINSCRNQLSATTHVHPPRFATNGNAVPPFQHAPSYRPSHEHGLTTGKNLFAGNAKAVVHPAKRLPSRARSSAPRMLECTHEGCGKAFSMPHLLRNHLIWHSDARPFQCPHCKASFKRNCDMNRHIKSTHIHISRRFVCQECQMTWNRVDRYNSHMRTVHMGKTGNKPAEHKNMEDISLLARFETEVKRETEVVSQPMHRIFTQHGN